MYNFATAPCCMDFLIYEEILFSLYQCITTFGKCDCPTFLKLLKLSLIIPDRLKNLYGIAGHHVHCTENSKQIFAEMELRGLVPNFYIHVSVSDLYIPRIGLPIMLYCVCGPIVGIYKSLRDT
jgi:hypothetical protein